MFLRQPETYFSYAWNEFWAEFSTGEAAMMMIGTWGFRGANEFFDESGQEWDWVPLPLFSDSIGEYNYELATGSTLSVNAETANPEAVITVLDWLMSSPEHVLNIASGYGYGEFMIPLHFTPEDFPADADPRIVRFFADFAAVTGEGRVGYTTWTFWPADPNVCALGSGGECLVRRTERRGLSGRASGALGTGARRWHDPADPGETVISCHYGERCGHSAPLSTFSRRAIRASRRTLSIAPVSHRVRQISWHTP
ncbi:MAG: extracellular solute-binding protein [Chloroflexi bacterium]|nr:extracellular solute-binding protein [Chloroflexota bacterium]